MEYKRCFKCSRVLPVTEFYRHSQMRDGRLNKCKECTKRDVHKDYVVKSENVQFVESERARGREKYKRLDYLHKYKDAKKKPSLYYHISAILRRKGYDTNGKESHHWNYNQIRSVFLLSRRAHRRLHKHIKVDGKSGVEYTEDGLEIRSAEQAESVFIKILASEGILECPILINI